MAGIPSSVTAIAMDGTVVVIAKVLRNMFWMDALRLIADCELLLLEDSALVCVTNWAVNNTKITRVGCRVQ